MKKNDFVITDIVSYSSDGAGIGKIDEYILFVPFTCVGDRVKVKILKVKKNILYCKAYEFINKASSHIEPLCDCFDKCGACSLLHMDYAEQLIFKRTKVIEAMKRIGKLELTVHPVTPSEKTCYRNKVLIPVGEAENGEIIYGFYRRKSHDIIKMNNCVIQDDIVNSVCESVVKWMSDNNVKPYNYETKKGAIRHIYIRKAFGSNEVMAGVVSNKKKLPYVNELVSYLSSIPQVVAVIHNINIKDTNVILGDQTDILWGKKYLTDILLNKKFHIGSLSFYQINRAQTENLYSKAGELLSLNKDDILYDIYCGIGTIGICLGDKVKKIIGVEVISEAVELARKNAALNGIENYEYYVGKAEEISFDDKDKPTAVVIDPPRKGCDAELINTLLNLMPEKICYISCDCATLARDLKIFNDSGLYNIGEVYPFDMFPNTEHVECCVLFNKK